MWNEIKAPALRELEFQRWAHDYAAETAEQAIRDAHTAMNRFGVRVKVVDFAFGLGFGLVLERVANQIAEVGLNLTVIDPGEPECLIL